MQTAYAHFMLTTLSASLGVITIIIWISDHLITDIGTITVVDGAHGVDEC